MRLLISVTDAAEAVEAAAGGADIIDVKDPGAGALGQASPECVAEVRRVVPAGRPVTAALGDGPFEPSAVARQATCLADSGRSSGFFASIWYTRSAIGRGTSGGSGGTGSCLCMIAIASGWSAMNGGSPARHS